MARAIGVVGAGYGDEGKGLVTDALAARMPEATVVRTNGGAQAGHTVHTSAGARHVFHHFGSGALAGRPTHLGQRFVSHPMVFEGEAEDLRSKGGTVLATADPRGAITTPYDMMINQAIERARGGGRHGSCGLGFGETLERCSNRAYATTVEDLRRDVLPEIVARIRREWLPLRMTRLGLWPPNVEWAALIANDAIEARFIDDCRRFGSMVTVREDRLLAAGDLILEGAQGLMLDQDYGAFPYVTRSNTGAVNMAEIAAQAGIEELEVVYVTRCYVSRHGAGPLANADVPMDFVHVVDDTNVPNDWQGTLRIAPLDVDVLAAAIEHDVARTRSGGVIVRPGLAVTCVDQLRDHATIIARGRRMRVRADDVAAVVAELAGLDLTAISAGPRREDVTFLPPPFERVVSRANGDEGKSPYSRQ